MKKAYVKPEVESVDFSVEESLLALNDDSVLSEELGNQGDFDF